MWGCGPVGQFAIKSAYLLGAERVIAIDKVPERLRLAKTEGKAETLNFERDDVLDRLRIMTGGRGPDACIDAVGLEVHGHTPDALLDRVRTSLYMATDRAHVLREAILACRKGGTVSVPGVCVGVVDLLPFGPLVNKALTVKTGQTHVHRYVEPLMRRIENGEINPAFIITDRLPRERAPEAYKTFKARAGGCIKVVLKP